MPKIAVPASVLGLMGPPHERAIPGNSNELAVRARRLIPWFACTMPASRLDKWLRFARPAVPGDTQPGGLDRNPGLPRDRPCPVQLPGGFRPARPQAALHRQSDRCASAGIADRRSGRRQRQEYFGATRLPDHHHGAAVPFDAPHEVSDRPSPASAHPPADSAQDLIENRAMATLFDLDQCEPLRLGSRGLS